MFLPCACANREHVGRADSHGGVRPGRHRRQCHNADLRVGGQVRCYPAGQQVEQLWGKRRASIVYVGDFFSSFFQLSHWWQLFCSDDSLLCAIEAWKVVSITSDCLLTKERWLLLHLHISYNICRRFLFRWNSVFLFFLFFPLTSIFFAWLFIASSPPSFIRVLFESVVISDLLFSQFARLSFTVQRSCINIS